MRLCVASFILAGLVFPAIAGEPDLIEKTAMPPNVRDIDDQYPAYIDKKAAMVKGVLDKRAAKAAELDAKLKKETVTEWEQKLKPLGSAQVKVDEETLPVKEPSTSEDALNLKGKRLRDEYEISPDDFDIMTHERWMLNKSDFRIDRPQYIVSEAPLVGTRWLAFTYSIVNSTTKPRRIAPIFTIHTNRGVVIPEGGGFYPSRELADSVYHPLADSGEVRDNQWLAQNVNHLESTISMGTRKYKDQQFKAAVLPEPLATFEPGQTRWGAAVWPWSLEKDDFIEMKIVAHGTTNAHDYDRKRRRALVLTFTRNDDEFDVERSTLKYQGKEYQWLWMWDQDINVPIPADAAEKQIKAKELATPAGAKRFVWSFPYTMGNSTPNNQSITVRNIAFVIRDVELDVGGQKVKIDIKINDDGRSSIYKAQYLREIGVASPPKDYNRFAPDIEKAKEPEGLVFKIEAAKSVDGRAVFDANDIDWQDARLQIETALTLSTDRKAAGEKRFAEVTKDVKSKPKAPEAAGLYDPIRNLTLDSVKLKDGRTIDGEVANQNDEGLTLYSYGHGRMWFAKDQIEKIELGEVGGLRKQVLEKIPAAVEEQVKKKQVVAFFTCEAGLASGTYRISRSYKQRGVIEEDWLKAWEAIQK